MEQKEGNSIRGTKRKKEGRRIDSRAVATDHKTRLRVPKSTGEVEIWIFPLRFYSNLF
jgi:hypothetical protein